MTESDPIVHVRWSRTAESSDFFVDEDHLRGIFHLLLAVGAVLLGLFAAGLWRLQRAALAPPVFIGFSHGLIFSGKPASLATLGDADLERQLTDTVAVLFERTERGLPPAIRDFCSPETVAAVERDYREAAKKYPAGYVQTFDLQETRTLEVRPGYRHLRCRGLLSSRSAAASQISPVYLDCDFRIGPPAGGNATGWRLARVSAIGRDDYYRDERERAARRLLGLPASP